jgi:hypothetical protein
MRLSRAARSQPERRTETPVVPSVRPRTPARRQRAADDWSPSVQNGPASARRRAAMTPRSAEGPSCAGAPEGAAPPAPAPAPGPAAARAARRRGRGGEARRAARSTARGAARRGARPRASAGIAALLKVAAPGARRGGGFK